VRLSQITDLYSRHVLRPPVIVSVCTRVRILEPVAHSPLDEDCSALLISYGD
jgi:hypothetical protein